MKKIMFFLLLFALSPGAGSGAAASPPFSPGEKLGYDWTLRTFLFVTAGRGRLSFSVAENTRPDPGSEALRVRVEADGSVRLAGSFRGELDTWFDPGSFQPFKSEYRAEDRRGVTRESLRYCLETSTGVWNRERVREGKNDSRREEFPLPESFYDPISLMYYLRTIDLEEGASFDLPVVADRKDYVARVTVGRRTRIRIMGKAWDAWLIKPDISLGGSPVRDRSLEIYVSADARRLPLRLTTRAPLLGFLTADLKSHESAGR